MFGAKEVFLKKSGSVTHRVIWVSSTMRKHLEKNNDPIPRKHLEREKDEQTVL